MAKQAQARLVSIPMLQSDTVARPAAPILELNEPTAAIFRRDGAAKTSFTSIGLVLLCTIIGAAAQVLMRMGAVGIENSSLAGIMTNWPLLGGYACLAANTGLLILALRDGQLSVLYPIIALTYVWVTILSPLFFGDLINGFKVAGVALIVLGVSSIGLGSRS